MLINALSVIIGLFGTIALSGTLSLDVEKTAYTNSTVAFLFLLMAVIILRYVYLHLDCKDKKGSFLSAIYVLGLAFALTVGKQLHTVGNLDVSSTVLWIQMFVIAVFFHGPVWYLLQWFGNNCGVKKGEESNRKGFLLTWLVIIICWIPVFLAFYPGVFAYDAEAEYVQVATRVFTTHHPLLHVLLLGGSVCFGNKFLGSYNTGIALYTMFQMVVLSGVFSYTLCYLRQFLLIKIYVAAVFFYGLFPVFPMYAVCSAKDTLFCATFLVMLVQMCKLYEQYMHNGKTIIVDKASWKLIWKTWDIVLFIVASVCMMLFRHNGVIAYVALLLGVAVLAIVKCKKTKLLLCLVTCMILSFVLYKGVDKTISFVLHATEGGSQELLTVPIQQLARTYNFSPEVFSEEEKEILFAYIPEDILELYDADLADAVKFSFNNTRYSEDMSEFWDLWGTIALREPDVYLNAWLMTSYGYWYPDTVINVYGGQQRITYRYGDSSYFGFETELPGVRDSKFPWLEEQYRKMSLELYQQNVPGISMLFSPGFLFWLFMGCFLIAIYRNQYERILPMVAIFLLWGTVIPGPTFLVRYVLILWFAAPLYLQTVMVRGNTQ